MPIMSVLILVLNLYGRSATESQVIILDLTCVTGNTLVLHKLDKALSQPETQVALSAYFA